METPLSGVRALPLISPDRLSADDRESLEHCRVIADWARNRGFLAILAPSAAAVGERTLAIYPENRPSKLTIEIREEPVPLNYGDNPLIDE